jgi:hypothetical protein
MTEAALIIDRKGLAKKLLNRPKAFIIYELLQNAWDENVTRVDVKAQMVPGRPLCEISIEDDSPEGFHDLSSVYTMFKDSKKAPDPTKRGRFEMGEKLVLALATFAEVTSTKGTISFQGDKRENFSRPRREKGTIFKGTFKMTREEFLEMDEAVRMLMVPRDIETYYNGEKLLPRKPIHTFTTTLQTVKSDDEGNLKSTHRKTEVYVYAILPGETAHIYEMGIPVVSTGDLWHYDVQQRVPVNWERDNVPPVYLRTLRVEVLNALHGQLQGDLATTPWVTSALDDVRVAPDAVKTVVRERFGEKAVIFDPSDTEGTKMAMSQGYTVIPGGAFSSAAWENVRFSRAVLPAGQVTPSPKPYDPNGHPEKVIPESEWTSDMKRRAEFAQGLFRRLVWQECYVVIVREPQVSWSANFGERGSGYRLCLNYGRLGKAWFDQPNRYEGVLDLLLHEFCHYQVKDHLSHEMHELATKLGARLANLALNEPEFFR